MNSGPTAERIYDAIKRRVLGHEFRPGERLDPARLGDELHSSVTPVRDALHILTGEGLVETRTSEGFHVPAIDAPALQDLYQWNAQILLLALRAWPRGKVEIAHEAEDPRFDGENGTARLFAQIAALSINAEHSRAIASANDRLLSARLAEGHVLPEPDAENDAMALALSRRDTTALRPLILAYHRRRDRAAAAIVRALYRQL